MADPGFFYRRGAPLRPECLLFYFNTIKPHFFFLQNTSCIRKPQVIPGGGGVRAPCTLPLDPPLKMLIRVLTSLISTFVENMLQVTRSINDSLYPEFKQPVKISEHFSTCGPEFCVSRFQEYSNHSLPALPTDAKLSESVCRRFHFFNKKAYQANCCT